MPGGGLVYQRHKPLGVYKVGEWLSGYFDEMTSILLLLGERRLGMVKVEDEVEECMEEVNWQALKELKVVELPLPELSLKAVRLLKGFVVGLIENEPLVCCLYLMGTSGVLISFVQESMKSRSFGFGNVLCPDETPQHIMIDHGLDRHIYLKIGPKVLLHFVVQCMNGNVWLQTILRISQDPVWSIKQTECTVLLRREFVSNPVLDVLQNAVTVNNWMSEVLGEKKDEIMKCYDLDLLSEYSPVNTAHFDNGTIDSDGNLRFCILENQTSPGYLYIEYTLRSLKISFIGHDHAIRECHELHERAELDLLTLFHHSSTNSELIEIRGPDLCLRQFLQTIYEDITFARLSKKGGLSLKSTRDRMYSILQSIARYDLELYRKGSASFDENTNTIVAPSSHTASYPMKCATKETFRKKDPFQKCLPLLPGSRNLYFQVMDGVLWFNDNGIWEVTNCKVSNVEELPDEYPHVIRTGYRSLLCLGFRLMQVGRRDNEDTAYAKQFQLVTVNSHEGITCAEIKCENTYDNDVICVDGMILEERMNKIGIVRVYFRDHGLKISTEIRGDGGVGEIEILEEFVQLNCAVECCISRFVAGDMYYVVNGRFLILFNPFKGVRTVEKTFVSNLISSSGKLMHHKGDVIEVENGLKYHVPEEEYVMDMIDDHKMITFDKMMDSFVLRKWLNVNQLGDATRPPISLYLRKLDYELSAFDLGGYTRLQLNGYKSCGVCSWNGELLSFEHAINQMQCIGDEYIIFTTENNRVYIVRCALLKTLRETKFHYEDTNIVKVIHNGILLVQVLCRLQDRLLVRDIHNAIHVVDRSSVVGEIDEESIDQLKLMVTDACVLLEDVCCDLMACDQGDGSMRILVLCNTCLYDTIIKNDIDGHDVVVRCVEILHKYNKLWRLNSHFVCLQTSTYEQDLYSLQTLQITPFSSALPIKSAWWKHRLVLLKDHTLGIISSNDYHVDISTSFVILDMINDNYLQIEEFTDHILRVANDSQVLGYLIVDPDMRFVVWYNSSLLIRKWVKRKCADVETLTRALAHAIEMQRHVDQAAILKLLHPANVKREQSEVHGHHKRARIDRKHTELELWLHESQHLKRLLGLCYSPSMTPKYQTLIANLLPGKSLAKKHPHLGFEYVAPDSSDEQDDSAAAAAAITKVHFPPNNNKQQQPVLIDLLSMRDQPETNQTLWQLIVDNLDPLR